jgi:PAS domain S-box-containing protein
MGSSPPADATLEHAAPGDDGTPVLAAVLGQLNGVVWATDLELRCRFATADAARRVGVAAGVPIGDSLRDPALLEAHRLALHGTAGRHGLALADGALRCLVDPLRDPTGAIVGVLVTAANVAESARAVDLVEMHRAVFAATLEHSPNAVTICDADGRFLYSNETARRFEDRASEGTQLSDTAAVWGQWHDEHGSISVDALPLARALGGETVPVTDIYKLRSDGTEQHMRIAAVPIRDIDGTIIGATASATDVSDRKNLERELRALNQELEARVRARTAELEQATRQLEQDAVERAATLDQLARSEQLLNDVVNHSNAVINLKDLDGRYLLINRHFENLFHVRDAEQRGRTDADLFAPEVAAAVTANDRRVLTSGEPMQFEEAVPHDGEMRTYVSVKFPLRDRDGTVYGVCGMSTDITERKQMEAALRHSQATLSAIIESSSDPIVALDQQWQLVAMNAATAALIPVLIGSLPPMHAHLGTIPEEFAAPWRSTIERALNGERFTVERTLAVGDRARIFSVSFNPTVQDEVVTGVAIFGRETTETRRAEEQSRQHQAELAHVLRLHTMGEMAASLAHEVNQPLGAIAAYAQGARNRIRAGDIGWDELLAVVENISNQALRAGEITRRVRELLRKEEGLRAPVDVADIIGVTVGIIGAAARRLEVTVATELDATPLFVLADRIQIEQVVLNLLLNAIDAAAAAASPRQVLLRASAAAAGMVEVAVNDSGAGIDPTLESRVFEPFFTTKAGGLGMGLAISRSIIAAHDGQLWLTHPEGGGATFHFTLPAVEQS